MFKFHLCELVWLEGPNVARDNSPADDVMTTAITLQDALLFEYRSTFANQAHCHVCQVKDSETSTFLMVSGACLFICASRCRHEFKQGAL